MRVLSVGNMYPPHHFGGYELVWRAAVEHLRELGHEVRVLTTDTRTRTEEQDDDDVHRELQWHLRGGEFKRLRPRDRVRIARHNHGVVDRHLHQLRPEVVTWWSMGGLTLTLLETVRRRRLPAVAFVHDDWLGYGSRVDPWLSIFSGALRRHLAPLGERVARIPATVDFAAAATYVFVSEHVRRRAQEVVPGLQRTVVAHSGIDPALLGGGPEREWRWRLLYVGRLDARKGVHTAIDALSHLPPDASLDIAGGWDEREGQRLRERATAKGSRERVRFLGHLGRDELIGVYDACDVVVFPVIWEEPWGLVPLEAMARGKPVVATGSGGSGEYLRHEENALLFPAGDDRSLAAAVARLAEDRELRERLRANGLATAPGHTTAVLNEVVEEAILAATRAGGPRGYDTW